MRVAVGSLGSSLIILFSPNPSIIFACNLQYEKFVCSWWKCLQMPTTRISIDISNLLDRQLRVVSHVSSHHLTVNCQGLDLSRKKEDTALKTIATTGHRSVPVDFECCAGGGGDGDDGEGKEDGTWRDPTTQSRMAFKAAWL